MIVDVLEDKCEGTYLCCNLLLVAQLEVCLAPKLRLLIDDVHPTELIHCCRNEGLWTAYSACESEHIFLAL